MSQEKPRYQEQYDILERTVQKLQSQEHIDIDQLVPMLKQASKAYELCKTRLDEVEKVLNEQLGKDQS